MNPVMPTGRCSWCSQATVMQSPICSFCRNNAEHGEAGGLAMSRFMTWVVMEAAVRATGVADGVLLDVARAGAFLKAVEAGRLRLRWP